MTKSNTGFQFIIEKGFMSELPTVSTPVSVPTIEEEIIVEKKPVFNLDVPEFMKNRVKPEPHVTTIYFAADKFKKEDEDREHPVVEVLYDALGKARKKIVNNPVFKYFIDDYQQEPKKKKGEKK